MQCPNSHHVHASSNEENAEVSRMINLAQRSPEFPQWLLFTWTEDAIGQCLRQLHCVHRCYYKHDRQRDISFLKTIFFPQLRTRGAIPFPPSSLSAARDGGAEGARNACVEPQFFVEVTECNYEICWAGIMCWFLQTHQLWVFTLSNLQSGLGKKKPVKQFVSFTVSPSSDCADLLSNGEDLALRESERESSFRHWNLNIPISQQAGRIHWGSAHRGPEGN